MIKIKCKIPKTTRIIEIRTLIWETMRYLCVHIPRRRRVKKGGKEARLRILAIFSFQQRQRVGNKNVPNWGAKFFRFRGRPHRTHMLCGEDVFAWLLRADEYTTAGCAAAGSCLRLILPSGR